MHRSYPNDARLSRSAPKVSILLPNRNHGRFLRENIVSILGQDFTDFELIVSDNASTDHSLEVIREYACGDPRAHVTAHSAELGMVAHLNWCLSQARGEYIKFVLADDKLLRPDALGRLVAMLDNDPQVVLASCAAQIIDERSEFQYVRDYFHRDLIEDGQCICRRCLVSGSNLVGEPTLTLFRRRCVDSGFNSAYRHWVDAELAFRVLEQGRFAYCNEALVAFRIHAGQQTSLNQQEFLHRTEFYKLLLDFADRPWLGREVARGKLFEELYRSRGQRRLPPEPQAALEAALDTLGRQGYAAFRLRRRLVRPFRKLGHSLLKRLRPSHESSRTP